MVPGLDDAVESLIQEIGTDDERTQFYEDCKTLEADCKDRIQNDEITQEEANTRIAHAVWWDAMREIESAEHFDASFANKLREFVDIRRMLVV